MSVDSPATARSHGRSGIGTVAERMAGLRPQAGTVAVAVLVAAAYFAGAKLGFAFTFRPRPIAVVWLPNALLLAALLLTPARTWWILLAAVLPIHLVAELQSGVPASMVLAWYATNCGQALIAAALVRLLVGGPLRFGSLRHTGVFLACAVGFAPLLASFVDVGLVKLIGWGEGGLLDLVTMRFLSNALATVIVVPVIVTWVQGGMQSLLKSKLSRCLETCALFGGLLIAGSFAFESTATGMASVPALLYAPLPFLLWAVVRMGQRTLTLCLLLTFVLATFGALHGHGPFVDGTPEHNALAVQLFGLAISIPFLLFSAVMAELQRDRRAMALSEQRALQVFRSGPDPMAITRFSDGAILDVNDRWVEFFGYSRDEAIGASKAALGLYADEQARLAYLRLATQDRARDIEADMVDKAGGLHQVLLSGERLDIDGTDCMINVVHDVTRQRQVEREAQEQRMELIHLSRIAVLGELSGALAHELNQPLTAILSNAQTAQRLLARSRIDVEELREILHDIADEDKRAGEVIRRLRAMFKKGEPQFHALDVNELAGDTLSLASGNLATRHIRVETRLCPHALPVRGDRVQLQQVLLNLIMNACEAMEAPGSVRELRMETAPLADGRVQLFVVDGGPGLPDETAERLFNPFYTTKPQGLGLGLSISRSIVTAHGGQIFARNNPGRGATFRVVLPGQASPT